MVVLTVAWLSLVSDVTMDKSSGRKRSIDIGLSESKTVFIEGMCDDGLDSEWNDIHPARTVEISDHIVAVNCVRTSVDE